MNKEPALKSGWKNLRDKQGTSREIQAGASCETNKEPALKTRLKPSVSWHWSNGFVLM
tara:strand:- start:211 stop:384 length:174 start_codon:yes stop_codon:yes gene_type:complete